MLGTIRAFWNDQRGIAMILVAIMLPVLVGFAVLAIDMSRVNSLHNDLQNGADAMALAAAAELDGKSDSIVRADRALLNLVSNKYSFSGANNGPAVTLASAGVTRRYLLSLPASDDSPIAAANVITDEVTDAKLARFVEIKVTPVGFSAIFPISFLSGNTASNSMSIGSASVAGFSESVCNFTPMFICDPYSSLTNLGAALQGNSRPMFALKKQGANAQFGPGNYGFLQTPNGDQSTKAITQMVAATQPKACFAQNGVNTRTGTTPPINDGFNTRFDIYPNGNGSGLDPVTDPPAPNTIKGMVASGGRNNCSYSAPNNGQAANYKAVPRDNCFYSANGCSNPSTAPNANGRLGDGTWDRAGYWSVNHPNDGAWPGNSGLPADASRYQVYQWEINNLNDHGAEATTPACDTPTSDPKRRLVYVAIINCDTSNGGVAVQGSGGPYPVDAFASFFLTEPAGGPPNADIYGEIVDINTKDGLGTLDNFVRDEAQLYR